MPALTTNILKNQTKECYSLNILEKAAHAWLFKDNLSYWKKKLIIDAEWNEVCSSDDCVLATLTPESVVNTNFSTLCMFDTKLKDKEEKLR